MKHIERIVKNKLLQALHSHPVVFLNGPRQAGKSTLVQKLSDEEYPADYVTFDSATQMAAAAHSPEAFLRMRDQSLIIDEVQLVPEIFRALKGVVDESRLQNKEGAAGKFLLTGSANIMALPQLSDSLVGRMGVLTLYPLAASEVMGGSGDFLSQLFEQRFSRSKTVVDICDIMGRATFPEISGADSLQSGAWFDGYLTTILQRDVRALAEIEKLSVLPNLLRILASRAGSLVNDAEIARDAGLVHMTARNYKTLLKMLFLTFEVPPWFRNIGKRLVKSAKGYMTDSVLLCHLLDYNLYDLQQKRPEVFGRVLENFVASELLKLISYDEQRHQLYHFRTSDNKEVDFVIEKPNGEMAGIEVKSSSQLTQKDFKGLTLLQAATGADFKCGIVLYGGAELVPFGEGLWAVPLSVLWN